MVKDYVWQNKNKETKIQQQTPKTNKCKIFEAQFGEKINWHIAEDLFLLYAKQRRISSGITTYSHSNWLCHLCTINVSAFVSMQKFATSKHRWRTRSSAYGYARVYGLNKYEKVLVVTTMVLLLIILDELVL